MSTSRRYLVTLLAVTSGLLFAIAVAAPAAQAADLTVASGKCTTDTSALTLTCPSTTATGVNVDGVAVFNFGNVIIGELASITVTGTRPFELRASGSISLGGTIYADGTSATDFTPGPNAGGPGGGAGGADGTQVGAGPGGGGTGSTVIDGGGGGGYGGKGAQGAGVFGGTGGTGGAAYGNLDQALRGGSGGAGGGAFGYGQAGGGGGGGAVALVGAAVTLTATGAVYADGGAGACSQVDGSGGGSGGGIVINAGTVEIDGILVARGGFGGAGNAVYGDGGGGAGGRIAVQSRSFSTHGVLYLSVSGGTSGWESTSGSCSSSGNSPDPTGAAGVITFTHIDATTLSTGASTTINYGSTQTVATRLTDRNNAAAILGATVTLYERTSGGPWTKVTSKTTSSAGRAGVSVTPTRNTWYQWRFAGDWIHEPSTSATQSVSVAQLVSVHATKTSVRHGAPSNIYGTVKPPGAGQKVDLQRRSGTAWKTIASATLKKQMFPNGTTTVGYIFTVTPSQAGTYRYRVRKPAMATLAQGISGTITITAT